MNSEKPLVIVISRNYSTGLGLLRSIGKAGYPVDLLASTKKKGSSVIASSSKYVRKATEVITRDILDDQGEDLMEALRDYEENETQPMILFPADDFTTKVIDLHREELAEHFAMPGSTAGRLTEFMDKSLQTEHAKAAGLKQAGEHIFDLRCSIQIPQTVNYPCFVKPLMSAAGEKTEMRVCHDQRELVDALVDMKKTFARRSVVVQDFLPIDKEYDMGGVCLDQEIIIPGIIEKTRIACFERGVTMAGKMVPVSVLEDLQAGLVAFLRSFHYTGMFDLELFLCNGEWYFNEINFRSGGPHYFYQLSGVNLPEVFLQGLSGNVIHEPLLAEEAYGKSFVYEKVAWEDHINGYMSKEELDHCIAEADYTLLDNADDPKPGKHFAKRIRLSNLKHKVLKR